MPKGGKIFIFECAEVYVQKNMNILSSFALNRVLISDIDSSYMDKYAEYEFISLTLVKGFKITLYVDINPSIIFHHHMYLCVELKISIDNVGMLEKFLYNSINIKYSCKLREVD